MLKKIFTFLFFIFLSSCGYEAIHSKKNISEYNFSLDKLNFTGDREINLKIKKKLNNFTLKPKDKNYILKITTTSEKVTLVKNTSGDPTSFQATITLNIDVLINNKIKNNFIITENFKYNNNSNKFDLKRYEREIKKNLTEIATEKLIFKLANIK
ncbi:hypothetical protein OAB53_01510 [Candidatus Pelagibacter sp.]|nr:hypothetical protein [Candidatus Pelagibacter sp.]